MLKRIRIKGYKSFRDIEVRLSPLAVMFGPNAAGKSNLLDALQLLAKLGTSRTVKEAFEPPYRGKPLESFTIADKGLRGLIEQDRLTFSIEADLHLSDGVVEAVNREIREMRRPGAEVQMGNGEKALARVRERESVAPVPIIHAVSDPHIERWLLLDGAAFKSVFGRGCDAPDQKCNRDRYKQRLVQAIFAAGITPNLGGMEFAEDIVQRMDIGRTEQADCSFRRFVGSLRSMRIGEPWRKAQCP